MLITPLGNLKHPLIKCGAPTHKSRCVTLCWDGNRPNIKCKKQIINQVHIMIIIKFFLKKVQKHRKRSHFRVIYSYSLSASVGPNCIFNLKRNRAPGWLSRLNAQLLILVQVIVSGSGWWSPTSGSPGVQDLAGVSLSPSVPRSLPPPPPLAHALS